jgi:hypothetical protein
MLSASTMEKAMKETDAIIICPECGAIHDLTGVDIGGLELITLPVHEKGQWPDPSERGTMLMAESLSDPKTCPCSEHLVHVKRDTLADQEPEDHSDDPCSCGDPDCSRPEGHPVGDEDDCGTGVQQGFDDAPEYY